MSCHRGMMVFRLILAPRCEYFSYWTKKRACFHRWDIWTPYQPSNLRGCSPGSFSLSFPFACAWRRWTSCERGRWCLGGGCGAVVLEAPMLDFGFTNDPGVRFMQGKGCNRAHSANLPGRGYWFCKIRQGAGWYWWLKLVHPCRVKSFRKAMSTVMDDLGTDDKIIENLNLN